MKILKVFAALAAIFAVVLLGGGMLLPEAVRVERSVVINAKPEQIYKVVNGFARFNEWSPWATLDPEAQYQYAGPAAGVGARQSWTSQKPEVGSGSQEIVEVVANRLVRIQLNFSDWDAPSFSELQLRPQQEGTQVTWVMDAHMGSNPINRWFGLLMDGMIGKDYETGLAKLRALKMPELEGLDAPAQAASAPAAVTASDNAAP